jgi:hypothetical protein
MRGLRRAHALISRPCLCDLCDPRDCEGVDNSPGQRPGAMVGRDIAIRALNP